MEAIISYIVIFGLGITLATVYLFRKDKKYLLPMSEQTFPQLIMTILIRKEKNKIEEIVLRLTPLKRPLQISELLLELTNEHHEKKIVDLKPIVNIAAGLINLSPSIKTEVPIPFQSFKELFSELSFPYERFRITAETPEGKKFKSHELGLNSRWGLLKLDSGKYN